MSTAREARHQIEANPFVRALERVAGLAGYWNLHAGNDEPNAALKQAIGESRLIVNEAVQRELEIATRTQRRLTNRIVSLAAARSPQDIWSGQLEILSIIADASSEHSAVWADCCRSLGESCTPAPSGRTTRGTSNKEAPSRDHEKRPRRATASAEASP